RRTTITNARPQKETQAPATPSVGREAELATLRQALAQLPTSGTRVVVVAGEPGSGKTRLLAEFGRYARDAGFHVRSGRARQADRLVPLGPLLDASIPGALHERSPQAVCDLLATLVTTQPDTNGWVLLLDDLHWADP